MDNFNCGKDTHLDWQWMNGWVNELVWIVTNLSLQGKCFNWGDQWHQGVFQRYAGDPVAVQVWATTVCWGNCNNKWKCWD